jgi:hypothetical protein
LYYLELDGADDSFLISPVIELVTNMTHILGVNRSVGDESFDFARTDSFEYYGVYWAGSDDKLYIQLGDTGISYAAGDTAGRYVLTGTRDGSAELIRRNGVQIGTRASPALTEGGDFDVMFEQNGFYSASDWYGCILSVTTTLSGGDLAAAEEYMAAKTGAPS